AGAFVCRLHQDARRAPAPGDRVVQRAVFQLDLEELAARFFHRFLHRDGHFARLALAHADAAVAVADHGERGEAEHAAALHHLGYTVHRDLLLAQAVAALFVLHPGLDLRHSVPLELQAAGSRRVGEGLDAAVIAVAGAVEGDFLDALFLRFRGDAAADELRRLAV